MVFSIFRELYNHYHKSILEHSFSLRKETPHSLEVTSISPQPTQPSATTNLFSDS